jgi:hypothetical protein
MATIATQPALTPNEAGAQQQEAESVFADAPKKKQAKHAQNPKAAPGTLTMCGSLEKSKTNDAVPVSPTYDTDHDAITCKRCLKALDREAGKLAETKTESPLIEQIKTGALDTEDSSTKFGTQPEVGEDPLPTYDEKIQALIDRVLASGEQFQAIYLKLTTLFDEIRPDVQELKDDVFKVSQGSEGVEVNIRGVMMDWETFCASTWKVGTKRINQLLEIKDKGYELTSEPKKKVTMSQDEFNEHIEKAREEGKKNADPVGSLKETLESVTDPGDKAYTYFEMFKNEPQTLATELSALLIHLGLDKQQIEEVLTAALKDAKKTLCQLANAEAAGE